MPRFFIDNLSMDSVEIVADASMGSVRSSGDSAVGVSSVDSYNDHSIVQNDSGNQSMGTTTLVHAPISPERSTQSVASSPSSAQRIPNDPSATPQSHNSPNPARMQVEPSPQFGMPTLEQGANGVLLGVQQLELQQIALEQRRHYAPDPYYQDPIPGGQAHPGFSDDERTEPSSSATGNTGDNPAGYTRSDNAATSTFGRLVQTTRVSLMHAQGFCVVLKHF